jgi:hypothetical protein
MKWHEAVLADEPAAAGHRRVACRRNALFIISVDAVRRSRAVADAGDAAAFIGKHIAFVGQAAAFIAQYRLVGARAVHISAQHDVRAVIFRDQVAAVIGKTRGRCGVGALVQTASRVIGQDCSSRAGLELVF